MKILLKSASVLLGVLINLSFGCTEVEKGKYVITLPTLTTPTEKPSERSEGKVPVKASIEAKEVSLPQTFRLEGIWKIAVDSVEFLPETKNLQFNLLIENLQDTPKEFYIGGSNYILDNLGNEYRVSGISPSGKRKVIQGMPLKVRLTFPELNQASEAIIFYLHFWGTDLRQWSGAYEYINYVERVVGPIKLGKISKGKEELKKEITFPKTFGMEDGSWSVTVAACQLLEKEKIQFALLIKNLQEGVSEYRIDNSTYLLDNLANEYRNPEVSKAYEKVTPGTPVMTNVTFSQLNKEAEAFILYLGFVKSDGILKTFIIGPMKITKYKGSTREINKKPFEYNSGSDVKTPIQDALLGKWIPEIPKPGMEDLETSGAVEFRRDGTMISTLINRGKWEISQRDEIRFYIPFLGKNLEAKGRVEGDNIIDLCYGNILDKSILAKQKDAQLIKTASKVRVWSNYISETKANEDAVAAVKLREDGRLLFSIFFTERWKLDGRTIKIYRKSGEQGPWNFEIENDKLLVKPIDPDISHISFVPYVKETPEVKRKGQEKILYSLYSENTKTCSLWAINPDGSGKMEILPKLPSCLASVSRDGAEIALITGKLGKCGSTEVSRISLINPKSEGERSLSLLKTIGVKKLLWSPDGSKIALDWNEFNIKTKSCHGGWYVMNVETGKMNSVGVPWISGRKNLEGAWKELDWWPDGKKLFVLQSGKKFGTEGLLGTPRIWFSLINDDGKEELCWETEGGWIESPKISPDGTKVAFLGQYQGGLYIGSALFVKELKGNKVNYTDSDAVLTRSRIHGGEEGILYSFYWSPDGARIVLSDERSIHLVNADGSNPKRIFDTTEGNGVEVIGWIAKF